VKKCVSHWRNVLYSGDLQLTNFLTGTANRLVILVKYDTDFIHQTDLFLIVTFQVIVLVVRAVGARQMRVDFRHQSKDITGIESSCTGEGSRSGAHVCV